jgi:predicted ATPase
MLGHRLMGLALFSTGDLETSRVQLDQGIALYNAVEHRPLATRFGVDVRVSILSFRSTVLWMLGYPEAALADARHALQEAREIGQAATMMYALFMVSITHICCREYPAACAEADELIALAEEKGASLWKAWGTVERGSTLAMTGKASDAVSMITSGINACRSTAATLMMSAWLLHLSSAYVELGKYDDARRCIDEAMTAVETTKETWFEAEVHRIAGEIALASPERDSEKAERYFERALAVARQQHAKSWEMRAAMSLAQLWRDQGKREGLASFSLRSTAGLPKGLTRAI